MEDEESEVIVLAMCESSRVYLRPNVLYRFEVVEGCQLCAEHVASLNDPQLHG